MINISKNSFSNIFTSKKNVLRGFHFQSKFKQSKYVNVLKGKILDVVVDLRKRSKTFQRRMHLDFLYQQGLPTLIIVMKKKI